MMNFNTKKLSFKQTFILVVILSFATIVAGVWGKPRISNIIQNNITIPSLPSINKQEPTITTSPTPSGEKNGNKCVDGYFEEKKDLWEIDKYFTVDNEGYYCPNRPRYEYWEIWYKERLPIGFTSATLRYLLKDKTSRNNIPSPAVFSYGDNQKRFYTVIVPDGDLKGIRFKGYGGAAEPQGRLKEEINIENEMTMTVKPRVPNPSKNEIKVTFDITYISRVPGDQMPPEPFEYDTKVPTVNLEEKGAKKQFGFGTFNGDCIKPIWFEVCP